MARLTGKMMEDKLKIGWGISDFARRLGMSEEEFIRALKKQFSAKAYYCMMKRLEQNEKRGLHKEKVDKDTINECTSTLSLETETVDDELQYLTEKADAIRTEIREKEISREKLRAQKKKIREELREQKREMINLRDLLQQKEHEIEEMIIGLKNISEEMSQINILISESHQKLLETEQSIETLKKVTVFLYENGDVEIDPPEHEVPTVWRELFKQFTANEVMENLTIKQIRTLAKAVALKVALDNKNLKSEFIFDSEEVQQLFESLFN